MTPTIRSTPNVLTRLQLALRGASAALVLAFVLSGCAAKPPQLVLTSQDDASRMFSTTFDEAYVARADDGSYDVLLVSDGVDGHAHGQRSADPAAPLQPTDTPPLRHLVHVRILWQPWHRSREADPTLTNASIHWYVTHRGIGRELDLLRYDGAGHVTISRGSDRSNVAIRHAGIEPAVRQGGLSDPIGPARLTGRIVAENDPQRVAQLLGEIRAGVGSLAEAAGATAGQDQPRPQ